MFKEYAIDYAKRGWKVFPCASNGKVPLTSQGYKDASNDITIVETLFSKYPNANIGLCTGKDTNFFVVDIDTKNGAHGDESLVELIERYEPLPHTIESITWSGGRHLFFKYPAQGVGCRTGIRPGIDIRGDGGYVIAPPSVINEKAYAWELSNPEEMAEAPEWLLDMIVEKPVVDVSEDEAPITAGKRNSTLISIAGKMRSAGCEVEQIEEHLLQFNKKRCRPPLPKREVLAIARSSGRYSKAVKPVGKDSFNCNVIADNILTEHKLVFPGDLSYEYDGSCYQEVDGFYIKKLIGDKLGAAATIFKVTEVTAALKRKAYLKVDKMNSFPLLNLKNGMFNIDTKEILPHDPQYYSTIQLPVEYLPDADCPVWLNTLKGVFGDKSAEERNQYISVLQEFFGLCLTRETKYEKALFMLGEGRNGKSTLLFALENVLGHANYSAVTLEDLIKPNYVSEIYGKLTNISIETNAKTSIYDAKFKAIVSGDTVTADRKYGHPFKFHPFCKMIFALNNMPQVNDKTDAFYKRLITLRLTRQFTDIEQDRELRSKLLPELNGIFLWMLAGYQRLKQRGYFDPGESIEQETEEYRKENNSVLSFVEEKCHIDATGIIAKDTLYEVYRDWCKASGMLALSKKKFGMQLVKHFNLDKNARGDHGDRIWQGIQLIQEGGSCGRVGLYTDL
jgi:putative DNA primase/helicase